MDSQRVHLRSTVIVDEALLKQLPEVNAEFDLTDGKPGRIVASRLIVDGGATRATTYR